MDEIAILMAAGLGTRMLPLTKTTPKPLIPVQGIPMIETLIKSLLLRPISRIYIVVGYLKEQFEYLREKYPEVRLVVNQEYEKKNNISSIKSVEDILGSANCFICEADLWIRDSSIFCREFQQSCYFGKPFSGYCADWILEHSNGRISRIKKGGNDAFQMVGISFFCKEDALKVREAIKIAYKQPEHEALFWDQVIDHNLDILNLSVYPVKNDAVIELDTVEELLKVNA